MDIEKRERAMVEHNFDDSLDALQTANGSSSQKTVGDLTVLRVPVCALTNYLARILLSDAFGLIEQNVSYRRPDYSV